MSFDLVFDHNVDVSSICFLYFVCQLPIIIHIYTILRGIMMSSPHCGAVPYSRAINFSKNSMLSGV